MNCEWVKAGIIEYVYEEMADDARHELERHVERCAECAEELEAARQWLQAMGARPGMEPTPNLLASSRLRLQEGLEQVEPVSGWQRWVFDPGAWLRQVRFSPALAAAILMAGFAAGIMTTYGITARTARLAPGQAPSEASIAGIRAITQEPGTDRVQIRYDRTLTESTEGPIGDPRIQELLLLAARSNQNSGLRLDSIDVLTQKPEDDRVREALMYALRYDQNPGVRLKALDGLRAYVRGDIRVRDAVLEALINDPNAGVRTQAIEMLQAVRADSSVRVALEQLADSDQNPYIRSESRRVLNALPEIN
ncbi:MAG: HEAT repeat domain-containing protein [Terriglobales bacterium]